MSRRPAAASFCGIGRMSIWSLVGTRSIASLSLAWILSVRSVVAAPRGDLLLPVARWQVEPDDRAVLSEPQPLRRAAISSSLQRQHRLTPVSGSSLQLGLGGARRTAAVPTDGKVEVHIKEKGGGYMKGSPLYRKQQSIAAGGATTLTTVGIVLVLLCILLVFLSAFLIVRWYRVKSAMPLKADFARAVETGAQQRPKSVDPPFARRPEAQTKGSEHRSPSVPGVLDASTQRERLTTARKAPDPANPASHFLIGRMWPPTISPEGGPKTRKT